MSDGLLLNQVWDLLGYHNKAGHTPKETLLRLLVQHCDLHFRWSLEQALQNDTLTASLESRTTAELNKLWRVHGRNSPIGPADCPIVLLRIGAYEFIIDGNTRINKFVAENDSDSHSVIVVEAEQVRYQ